MHLRSLICASVTLLPLAPFTTSTHAADAPTTKPAESKVPKVDVAAVEKARADKNTVLLDVRTPQEYASGHLPGAVNLPVADKQFEQFVSEMDARKHYIVYCRSGIRSATAAATMQELGFKSLSEFPGGFVAWQDAGKPVEKGTQSGGK